MDDFFVSYKVHSGIYETDATGKEDQYFAGLWVQRENLKPVGYYPPVKCVELYEEDDVSRMFWQNIQGMWCPDINNGRNMPSGTTWLQNPSEQNPDGSQGGSDFFFVLDTCSHLSKMTGFTDCKTEEESQSVLEQVYVTTRIHTQFWNSKDFIRSGKQMNSQFMTSEVQLNKAVFQREAYSLVTNKITFFNNRWININYMPKWFPGNKYTGYDVSSAFNTIYPVNENKELPDGTQDVNPQNTYFSMRFSTNGRTKSVKSTREAVSNTFQRFGSYLALCLRFIGYILGAYQRFSLDNSMTKKLYNYVDEEQHEQNSPQSEPPQDNDSFKNNLKTEVHERRKPFRYSMWRFFSKKNFSSPWCLCCRHKDSDEDKLQGKARSRLYQELDILQIIQKLRVARFVAELKLSEEQRYLVNYHTEYMLFRRDEHAKTFSANRYTDHRKGDDGDKRDDRILANVQQAIQGLDPTNEDH